MNSEILKALVYALGGKGDELMTEIDSITKDYPNLSILVTDVVRNGAELAREVSELHDKVEILKDLLIDAGVIRLQEKSVDPVVAPAASEIKINDIIWHHLADEDLPN